MRFPFKMLLKVTMSKRGWHVVITLKADVLI